MALLVFQPAAAGAGIVRIYLFLFALHRFFSIGIIFVCSCNLCNLLPLYFLLDTYMVQKTDRILLNVLRHFVEHIISDHLIFNLRIPLSVSLQADSLTQLIHIIDVIHPLLVDDTKQNHTLQLTNLLLCRELGFFFLVELHSCFFQLLLQLILAKSLHVVLGNFPDWNDRKKQLI